MYKALFVPVVASSRESTVPDANDATPQTRPTFPVIDILNFLRYYCDIHWKIQSVTYVLY
jgi:hypothetical protein